VKDFGRDFYLVSQVGKIPAEISYWDYGGVVVFLVMLVLLIVLPVDGAMITMSAMLVMIFGGWVPPKDALQSVDFPLLALIGASLGFAQSVASSGLAGAIASFVQSQALPPLGALFFVAVITMILTNIVTNNAAAALAIPIALSIADSLNVSYKPFAMAVLYSASVALMSPIGYQTNTMVWGPGGYSFSDFMKIGIPLNIIYVTIACLIIPLVFPF
jgi:di/tricarboxylate transporter